MHRGGTTGAKGGEDKQNDFPAQAARCGAGACIISSLLRYITPLSVEGVRYGCHRASANYLAYGALLTVIADEHHGAGHGLIGLLRPASRSVQSNRVH